MPELINLCDLVWGGMIIEIYDGSPKMAELEKAYGGIIQVMYLVLTLNMLHGQPIVLTAMLPISRDNSTGSAQFRTIRSIWSESKAFIRAFRGMF